MIPFKANPPKCTELYNISIELLYFITLPSLIFNMNHKLYNKPFIFYIFTDYFIKRETKNVKRI